jgi:hypothetical protein
MLMRRAVPDVVALWCDCEVTFVVTCAALVAKRLRTVAPITSIRSQLSHH